MNCLGIYVRVSTEEQKKKGISLLTQKNTGIEFSKSLGWKYKIYEDGGISGSKPISERPQLKLLLDDISTGLIQGIHVIEFSRLSRSVETYNLIKTHFKEFNIKFYINKREEDLSDLNTELLSDVRSLLSTFEWNVTRKRIKDNLITSARKGRVGGGPFQPYGYKKGENKMLVIDEEEEKVVKLIFDLSIKGHGTKSISTILNDRKIPTKRSKNNDTLIVNGELKTSFIWKDSVVYGILKNPIYKGERKFKDETVSSPIIIDQDVFDLVQLRLKDRNRFKNTTNKNTYLLKGLIYCFRCNSKMSGYIKESRKMRIYRCNSKRSHKSHNCNSQGINYDFLNKHVLEEILNLPIRLHKSFQWSKKFVFNGKIEKLKKLNDTVDLYKGNLESSYSLNISNSEREKMINHLSREIELNTKEIQILKSELKYIINGDEIVEKLSVITKKLKLEKDVKKKQSLIRSIIEKILVSYVDNDVNEKPYYVIIVEFKIDNRMDVVFKTEYKVKNYKYQKMDHSLKIISLSDDSFFGKDQPDSFSLPLKFEVE
jgi:DNA invertase Pin-like site-specific DNA recombinase